MNAELSEDLKRRIVAWYTDNAMTMAEIAALAHCSIGLVSKVLRLQREFGQVTHPFSKNDVQVDLGSLGATLTCTSKK
jgi:transposase